MSIESVYQSLLRRNPDQGAYGTYAGLSDDQIANAIYGSAEYAGLQQPQNNSGNNNLQYNGENHAPVPLSNGLNDNEIRQLYQQYLHRNADQGGLDTWRGQSYDQVVQGIVNSGEYAQRNQAIPATPPPQNIAPVQTGPGQGGPADLNAIYQQYLGRGVDQSGAQTFAGKSSQDVINSIISSPEYAQLHPQSAASSGANQSDAAKKIQNLADTVFSLYRTNQNYDKQLNELNSLYPTDPAAYFKARIGLSGQQIGWQLGQNTPQNVDTYKKELQSFIPGAKAAGVTDTQIQDLVSTNAQTQAKVNAERILSDAKGPNGWINQNIPGGSATLLTAAAIAAPYLIPEMAATLGTVGAGALTGATLGGVNAAFTNQDVLAAILRGGVLGGAGAAASGAFSGAGNVASGGLDLGSNFTWNLPSASDMYNAQFVNAFANPTELGQPYAKLAAGPNVTVTGAPSSFNDYGATNTPLVNANSATSNAGNAASGGLDLGTDFTWNFPSSNTASGGLDLGTNFNWNNSSSGFNPASTLGSLYNTFTNGTGTNPGSGTNPGTGPYGTTPGSNGPGGNGPGGNGPGGNGPNTPNTPNVNPNIKIPGLKIPGTTTTPTLSSALRNPTLYQSAPGGLYKGNQNPFMFGKEQPVQNARQSYDPFAALNVPQIPLTETPNLLAQALRQG